MLNNPQYIVYEGGNYNDTDLVDVCHVRDINSPIYRYQSFFIKNGYDLQSDSIEVTNFKIGVENPLIVDYDILGFHKKRIIIKGELVLVEYYKNYDGIDSYSDIIVRETRVYKRNEIGIIQYRDILVEWYLDNDLVGLTKTWRKYYGPEEAIDEGVVRRKNMISLAKTVLLRELFILFGSPLNQNYGFDLLSSISNQIKFFEDGYTQPLRDAIDTSTKPYLNSNIKSMLIEELTF